MWYRHPLAFCQFVNLIHEPFVGTSAFKITVFVAAQLESRTLRIPQQWNAERGTVCTGPGHPYRMGIQLVSSKLCIMYLYETQSCFRVNCG